ncbi:MAG: carbohydrate kinase, partial [Clostridia bacterium]|nr:carbohydrate kinase [Clostridia bacterium]
MSGLWDRLDRFAGKRIAVIGDYCLDKYLYSDPSEDDVSVETGMPAWQVYEKKMSAGAAGTITNNLCALGASVSCLGIIGEDGEGFELLRALKQVGASPDSLIVTDRVVTSCYLKTMRKKGSLYEENLRFDLRNRVFPSEAFEEELLGRIRVKAALSDGIIVSDQYYERNSGLVTEKIRA